MAMDIDRRAVAGTGRMGATVGAGFGRTGTMSMQAALEMLGFTGCYHMREVMAHPGHAALWADAAAGSLTKRDQS